MGHARRERHPRRRAGHAAGGLLVLVAALFLVVPAAAAAASTVEGSLTASSLRFDETAPTQADAYLLGFQRNAEEDSAYDWSFQAERVDVVVTTKRYLIGAQELDNTTYTESHEAASGVLLERLPLAYLMATSGTPSSPAAAFGLQFPLPPDTLDTRQEIDFSITPGFDSQTPVPLLDTLLAPGGPGDSVPDRDFQQPWPSLERKLTDFQDSLTLTGDFVVHLFDMVFKVHNGTGETTTYDVTYGGWRGIDTDDSENTQQPTAEYNVTQAELHLQNATFTFRPEGRPFQVNLRSADLDVSGHVRLDDADGSLQYGTDLEQDLQGDRFELDAQDLHLALRPTDGGDGSPPDLDAAFSGSVRSASVDGRALDLEESLAEDAASSTIPSPAPGFPWLSPWLVIPLLLVLVVVGSVGVGRGVMNHQARLNPEYVIKKGHHAYNKGLATRARARSALVLRHYPFHQDAIGLQSMVLLQRQKHDEMLTYLKPYLHGPADDDGTLSVLYCVALRKHKGREAAHHFLHKVAKEHPNIHQLAQRFPELELEALLTNVEKGPHGESYI